MPGGPPKTAAAMGVARDMANAWPLTHDVWPHPGALWQSPPHRAHLLHGDLQSGNVMVHRHAVTLIDFQDLIWGFDVQDVSIALLAVEQHGDIGSWADAFRAGYEAVRPWPDTDPDTDAALRAARHLNILNFGMSVGGPDVDAFIARRAAAIRKWMAA